MGLSHPQNSAHNYTQHAAYEQQPFFLIFTVGSGTVKITAGHETTTLICAHSHQKHA